MSNSSNEQENIIWEIPFNINLSNLDSVVKAFFTAGADKKPVSVDDVSRLTQIYKVHLKKNANFLKNMKILKEVDHNSYVFEEKGVEYAKALSSGDQRADSLLGELFIESDLKELVNAIELKKSSGELDFESLFILIKALARVKDNQKFPRGVSPPYTAGITVLIDLLIRANLVPDDILSTRKDIQSKRASKSNKQVKKSEIEAPKRDQIQEPPRNEKPQKPTIKENLEGKVGNLPYKIDITVNVEAKDPESIKELINLLRELKMESQTE